MWRWRALITAESAIFAIFVVAYLYYLGRDVSGPTPGEVLEVPSSIPFACSPAASSSGLRSRRLSMERMAAFRLWWAVTIVLGAIFLIGHRDGVVQADYS